MFHPLFYIFGILLHLKDTHIFRLSILIFILSGCGLNSDFKENKEQGRQEVTKLNFNLGKALLASRIASLSELNRIIDIEYSINPTCVYLRYQSSEDQVVSVLEDGIAQNELSEAVNGGLASRWNVLTCSPLSIRERDNFRKIKKLARRDNLPFGGPDVAFYDLALASVSKIKLKDQAYKTARDSSEKGYINTFNHVTAQTFLTILFSEETADLVADIHERYNMPELITGKFSEEQLKDTINYPVDNYVDLINNEIGQSLGLRLKKHYEITPDTHWDYSLTTSILNDILSYYHYAFGVDFIPFSKNEKLIIRLTDKLNEVM